jgi:uncharacterized protein (DUF1697 family)
VYPQLSLKQVVKRFTIMVSFLEFYLEGGLPLISAQPYCRNRVSQSARQGGLARPWQPAHQYELGLHGPIVCSAWPADLRRLTEALGHTGVATYIQSGNVLFTSPDTDCGALADELEQAIARSLAVRPAVVVLSRADLARVIADNPFPDEADPRCLHAVFRRQDLAPGAVAAIEEAQRRARAKGSRDEAVPVGRALFLRTPDGLGRSELAAQLARSGVQADGTARNWAPVTRLAAMLASDG